MKCNIARTALLWLFLIASSAPLFAQGAETVEYMITWTQNVEPDVVGYVIYRSNFIDQGFVAIDSVNVATTEYIDTDLSKGVRYYYRIVAKNAEGLYSPYSQPVSGMTVPQDAEEATKDQCRIVQILDMGSGTYEVAWSSMIPSIGFVMYDMDADFLDSLSEWDNTYDTAHSLEIGEFIAPATYYLRSIAFDVSKNMTVSALDTLVISGEEPVMPTAPILSIYPVPYRPNMGQLMMTNLPEGGSVIVYSESGLEIWSAGIGAETSLTWDGTNKQGSRVMSGVYYVMVKDAGGKVVNKRAIMIVQ